MKQRIKEAITTLLTPAVIAVLVFGALVGSIATNYYVSSQYEKQYEGYYFVHPTDIGGFVIKEGKIYNLTRLRDNTYKP